MVFYGRIFVVARSTSDLMLCVSPASAPTGGAMRVSDHATCERGRGRGRGVRAWAGLSHW
jgi:hypothetical protein